MVFYTGKKPLSKAILSKQAANIRIIQKRPDLTSVIPNIIYSIESEKALPEYRKMTLRNKQPREHRETNYHETKSNPLLPKGTQLKKTLFDFDLGNLDEVSDEEEGDIEGFEQLVGANTFRPWEKDEECEVYVSGLGRNVTKNWGMMYCGGR